MALFGFGSKKVRIGDLSITLNDWQMSENSDHFAGYQHANGDCFSLNFFDIPPDIGASLSDIPAVRKFYRQMLIANDMAMVECDVIDFCGESAVYLLAKVPLDPHGFLFVGSYTLPKRDHSFVLKYQAVESTPTGMRETSVMEMQGGPEIDENTNEIIGWCSDPYDEKAKYPVMRNKADSSEFDEHFPDHPLSRTRSFMRSLSSFITISDRVKKAPPFNR